MRDAALGPGARVAQLHGVAPGLTNGLIVDIDAMEATVRSSAAPTSHTTLAKAADSWLNRTRWLSRELAHACPGAARRSLLLLGRDCPQFLLKDPAVVQRSLRIQPSTG